MRSIEKKYFWFFGVKIFQNRKSAKFSKNRKYGKFSENRESDFFWNRKSKLKIENSSLKTNKIDITGYLIEGKFTQLENINEVEFLNVEDETQINIKTETLDMYALKAKYNKKNNIIELFDNVKILRDNESISGNYAKINTLTESYKVTSKKSERVKILLNKTDE